MINETNVFFDDKIKLSCGLHEVEETLVNFSISSKRYFFVICQNVKQKSSMKKTRKDESECHSRSLWLYNSTTIKIMYLKRFCLECWELWIFDWPELSLMNRQQRKSEEANSMLETPHTRSTICFYSVAVDCVSFFFIPSISFFLLFHSLNDENNRSRKLLNSALLANEPELCTALTVVNISRISWAFIWMKMVSN